MTDQIVRAAGELLATGARQAVTPGKCPLCALPIQRGARVATVAGVGAAHLPCIAAQPSPR